MNKQKKCYIYTRVSTEIQVDGHSLDAHIYIIESVCTYHRYQDGQTFSILYSNGKYVEGRGGRVCRRIEL